MQDNILEELENDLHEPIIPEGKVLRTFKLLNAGKTTLVTSLSLIELNHHSEVANNIRSEEDQAQITAPAGFGWRTHQSGGVGLVLPRGGRQPLPDC